MYPGSTATWVYLEVQDHVSKTSKSIIQSVLSFGVCLKLRNWDVCLISVYILYFSRFWVPCTHNHANGIFEPYSSPLLSSHDPDVVLRRKWRPKCILRHGRPGSNRGQSPIWRFMTSCSAWQWFEKLLCTTVVKTLSSLKLCTRSKCVHSYIWYQFRPMHL